MPDFIKSVLSSISDALDFADSIELHGLPGNPWHVPIIEGLRENGNIQSEVELIALVWAFILMLKPRIVIETGCDLGTMTRAMGRAVLANGFGSVIGAEIDADKAMRAKAFCEGLPVTIHHGPASELPIEEGDFLFLDSSYESRAQELARVKPGAIAILHDTCLEPSMRAELTKYEHVLHVSTPRGFAMIQR